MNAVLEFLSEHGSRLAVGASAILALGCLLVWCVRQPIHKQRLAELSVIGALLWLGLAVLPLERRTAPEVSEKNSGWHAEAEGAGMSNLEKLTNTPAQALGHATPTFEHATPTKEIAVPTIDLAPASI